MCPSFLTTVTLVVTLFPDHRDAGCAPLLPSGCRRHGSVQPPARARKQCEGRAVAGRVPTDRVTLWCPHKARAQVCAVANFRDRQLEYYDSLNSVNRDTTNGILRWVGDDYRDKYGGDPEGRFDVCPPGWPCDALPLCTCFTGARLATPAI